MNGLLLFSLLAYMIVTISATPGTTSGLPVKCAGGLCHEKLGGPEEVTEDVDSVQAILEKFGSEQYRQSAETFCSNFMDATVTQTSTVSGTKTLTDTTTPSTVTETWTVEL